MAASYPLLFKTVDLGGPPGQPVELVPSGTPVADVFLCSPVPAGLNLRLIYGNNPDGLPFGPNGYLDHTDICPRITLGVFAVWDVASPGTLVKFAFSAAQGSQAVGA